MPIRFTLLLLAPLVLCLSACPTSRDPLACMDGCSHQDEKSFCDIDGVYPGTELANECIAPPSADACNRVESCATLAKPFCTDDSMGVCVECLTGEQCDSGEVCNESNECVAFRCTQGAGGDAACAGVDASQPYCGPSDTCVACLESVHCTVASSAICDPTDFQCRGCEANPECGSNVCGIATGICANEADIVYVAKAGTDGATCGTLASPCLTIDGAQGGIAKVSGNRNIVLVGAGSYDERITMSDTNVSIVADGIVTLLPGTLGADVNGVLVSGNSNVSIDGVNVTPDGGAATSVALRCNSAGGTPTLRFANGTVSGSGGAGIIATTCGLTVTGSTVTGNAGLGISATGGSATVTGSTVTGNAGLGISATGGSATVTGSTVTGNAGLGISATGGALTVTGSTVSLNGGGGIDIDASNFTVVNNFIVENGGVGSGVSGARIQTTSGLVETFDFNTVAGNIRQAPSAHGIRCDTVNLVARNNIFMLKDGNSTSLVVDCPIEYSLVDTDDTLPAGTGNVSKDAVFEDAVGGNYHLQSGSPGINEADPAATLTTDFDGDARAQGGRSDMGADEAE